VAAISQKQGGDAAEAFAAYAQGQGFAVTRDDAVELQMAAHAREEGNLSDAELDGVAGGLSFSNIVHLSFRDVLSGTVSTGVKLGKWYIGQEHVAEKWRI